MDKGIDTEKMVDYAMQTLTQSVLCLIIYIGENILQNLENVELCKAG